MLVIKSRHISLCVVAKILGDIKTKQKFLSSHKRLAPIKIKVDGEFMIYSIFPTQNIFQAVL